MRVQGILIDPQQLQAATNKVGVSSFSLAEFQGALEEAGVLETISYQAAKRHLQSLRRDGLVTYDRANNSWMFPDSPKPTPLVLNKSSINLLGVLRGIGAWCACVCAIGALATINASFAWELAETELLKFALVGALMASDVLRPFLMAQAAWNFGNSRFVPALLGIGVAFLLSPLSVLSSTSAIASSLNLGLEEQQQIEQVDDLSEILIERYRQLVDQAEELWIVHAEECNRGGCGQRAQQVASEASAIETEAQKLLLEITVNVEQPAETSFVNRSLKAYEGLGLISASQPYLLPLAIALSLELAALFGPALLLTHRK